MRFHDRAGAGQQLAARLTAFAGRQDVIVLGLPRGGIPVAHEVATRLQVPMDVFLVRKLGVPGHPELAMGAIAAGGIEVLSRPLIRELGIPAAVVGQVAAKERLELERRDVLYRGGRQTPVIRREGDLRPAPGHRRSGRVRVHAGTVHGRRPVVRGLRPDDRRRGDSPAQGLRSADEY